MKIRRSRRSAVMLLAAALALMIVFTFGLPGIAHAAMFGSDDAHSAVSSRATSPGAVPVASRMLASTDLPAGFQVYAPLTGLFDAKRARSLGSDLDPEVHLWMRDWRSERTSMEVLEAAADLGLREKARTAAASFGAAALIGGFVREPFAGKFPIGFRKEVRRGNSHFFELMLPMTRGPYFFALIILTPIHSLASGHRLMSTLAAVQVRKVPADTPETDPSTNPFYAPGEGGVIAFALLYLGVVNGIAYLRDPLRRTRKQRRSQRVLGQLAGIKVEDVTSQARRARRIALMRFGAQSLGVLVALRGLDPFLRPYWYIYLLAGPAIVWVAGRYLRRERFATKSRITMTGHRKFRIAVLLSVAFVLIILGYLAIVDLALINAQSQKTTVPQAQATESVTLWFAALVALALVAGGALCYRRARRLGAVEARRLLLRDSRPAVLYLRSFSDDRLELRTATLGRLSFIERFTPYRFDAFEEVLVRHLSFIGPVIALNAPGTSIAPLGAARETIDSADWRSTMATWMDKAALIVFMAPPGQLTPGVLWELETVSVSRQWDKTLVVVPPVRPENLERRWKAFLAATGKLWPSRAPLPAYDPRTLVLVLRGSAWTAITARQRSEWSYGAALHQAWTRSGLGQGPHVEEQLRSSAGPRPDGPAQLPGLPGFP